MAATAPRYAQLLNQVDSQVTGDAIAWGGGDGVIECFASNFNGCSCTIQALAQDGLTWIPLDAVNLVFTANRRMGFTFPPGFIRAVVTVANPTDLSVFAGALVH
jgi:hypothetical protein